MAIMTAEIELPREGSVKNVMDLLRNRIFTTQAMWRGSDFFPLGNKPIVYCTANYKAGTFKTVRDKRDWEWKVDKYSIVCWCYQDELLPF